MSMIWLPSSLGAGEHFDIRRQLDAEHARRPDVEAQRRLREQLRYKHCYTALALSRHTMQRLGDFGRKYFWFLNFRMRY